MADLALELSLHPGDIARLAKIPDLAALGGRNRAVAIRIIWHDTPDGALAAAGLSLAERRLGRETAWRLERMRPADGAAATPGRPPELVAEAADPAGLSPRVPERLLPVAAFEGQMRTIRVAEGAALILMSGEVRTVTGAEPHCRVTLSGEAGRISARALDLAGTVHLSVPAATMAEVAYATARPALPPPRLGPPALPPGLSVDEAFAYLIAHLLDVILHYAPRALAGEAPEPVHQMRVALRRMRSAFGLFRKVTLCPALDEAQAELKIFGAVLGPARDWDVFLLGTGAAVVKAFPGDAAVRRMAGRAARRREAGYAALTAYLEGAGFRRLALRLAILAAAKPWRDPVQSLATADESVPAETDEAGPADTAPPDLNLFAARALDRRLKRLIAPGENITDLSAEELHAIRLNGKRLRYAAEFFAPLFPGRDAKRFLRRIAVLQERLGHLNDGAVAADLMAEIGQSNAYAGGVVRGLVTAGGTGARGRIGRSWKRFRKLEPFWK